MITELETALLELKKHKETGDYTALYEALKLVIQANKKEPKNVDPLIRGLTNAVLEPLFIQVEKHLNDLRPREETENPGKVIFVDFAKGKAA
jgi:RNAse (barnase) inhibitor barstar